MIYVVGPGFWDCTTDVGACLRLWACCQSTRKSRFLFGSFFKWLIWHGRQTTSPYCRVLVRRVPCWRRLAAALCIVKGKAGAVTPREWPPVNRAHEKVAMPHGSTMAAWVDPDLYMFWRVRGDGGMEQLLASGRSRSDQTRPRSPQKTNDDNAAKARN